MEKDFEKSLKMSRDAFCRTILKYPVTDHLELRTACDSFLIAFDNAVEALRQPPVSGNGVPLPFDKVTRLEVISYREGDKSGRVFTHWKDDNKIEGQLQDKDRTLKIFIDKRK